MKGNPASPKCGFSRQTVGLLREKGVEFAWFDILSDQAVREGLKKMNDWPSESFQDLACQIRNMEANNFLVATSHVLLTAFPQIILNGELVGGLDVFKESLESGEWDEIYSSV